MVANKLAFVTGGYLENKRRSKSKIEKKGFI